MPVAGLEAHHRLLAMLDEVREGRPETQPLHPTVLGEVAEDRVGHVDVDVQVARDGMTDHTIARRREKRVQAEPTDGKRT
eukprot:12687-Eustigmatos_ZCMA.PRE.1